MRTLIEQRITDLNEQKAEILDQLCIRGKNNNLSTDIIISEGKLLSQIDLRLSELEIMLHQSKNFYGSKTPNKKQDGSEQ